MLYYPEPCEPIWVKVKYDKVRYEMAQVVVEGDDYELCEQYSGKMWAQDKDNSHAVAFASRPGDEKIGERIGFLMQVALAKVCGRIHNGVKQGLPVDFAYRKGGDIADFFLQDANEMRYTVDAKARKKLWGNGLVFYSKPMKHSDKIFYYSPKDYYVFGYRDSEDRRTKWSRIHLVGFNSKIEVWKKKYLHHGYKEDGSPSDHLNFQIPFSDMRPFRTLYNNKKGFSFEYTAPSERR